MKPWCLLRKQISAHLILAKTFRRVHLKEIQNLTQKQKIPEKRALEQSPRTTGIVAGYLSMQVACFRCNKAEFDIPNPMFFVTFTSCQGNRWMLRLSSVAEAIFEENLFHIVAFFLSENSFRTRLRFFRPENLSEGCELPQWQIWRRRPPLTIWIGKRSSRGFFIRARETSALRLPLRLNCCFLLDVLSARMWKRGSLCSRK
jgi:hypothetical protein